MRAIRRSLMVAAIGALVAFPAGAAADGGSFLEFSRTHHMPGQAAEASTIVFVPVKNQGVFDRGPFYGFVLPPGTVIEEGHPLPSGAINVGAFSIKRLSREEFGVRLSFTVPDVPGRLYTVGMCNLPCTVAGFREPLSAVLSVVQTQREAELLTTQSRLRATISNLRQDLEEATDRTSSLTNLLHYERAGAHKLTKEITRLEGEVERTRAEVTAARSARPLIDVWPAIGIGLALSLVAGAIVFRRRRPAILEVPDTLEGFERLESPARR